jgi:hypothetical protein
MRPSLKPFRHYERTSAHDRVKNDTSDFDQYKAGDSQDEKFTNHIIPHVHYLIKRWHEDSPKYRHRLAQAKPSERTAVSRFTLRNSPRRMHCAPEPLSAQGAP